MSALAGKVEAMEDLVRDLAERVEDLSQKVSHLMDNRPGPKPLKMIALRQPGVCAIDPECDSKECPHASIYRSQRGCQGTACVQISRTYYSDRRKDDSKAAKKRTASGVRLPAKKASVPAKKRASR